MTGALLFCKLRLVWWAALLLALPATLHAQEDVRVHGGFLSDSIKIGEETAYFLSARYPSSLTVLFPDSADSFAPFEYQRKRYFPTETADGISSDSTVYYLTTFEVDRVQYLDLPVYVIMGRDCTLVETLPDSLLITQFITVVPDTITVEKLPLKMNTAYQKVFFDFNFWMMVIIVSVLVAAALVAWLVFGKKIRRYFRTRKLLRNHTRFLETYDVLLARLKQAFSPPETEEALAVWKKYMEQLEARPYTKLTTRETSRLVQEPSLSEHLGVIDRAIYGHDTAVVPSLENLRSFAQHQFSKKLKETRHG